MDGVYLYNALTKSLERLVPNSENKVAMYVCGPTVYDSPHFGHARTLVFFDIARRILSDYFNFDVTYVVNITDVDDKIIRRAAELGISCKELATAYEKEFLDAMTDLNVRRPDFITRVTEHVPEILSFIEKLESKGLAYESRGSVYFDLAAYRKIRDYNVLRPRTTPRAEDGCSPSFSEEKRGREDFVLWKAHKENEPIFYESKWGNGRPGWHIGCSAMAAAVLGDRLDIHGGGIDLAFPHHENTIAQCRGCFGDDGWVGHLLHTGHLNVDGSKMSKSSKNFLTVGEVIDSGISPLHLRIAFLRSSWYKDVNYEPRRFREEADAVLKRFAHFVSNSESLVRSKNDTRSLNELDRRCLLDLGSAKADIDAALRNNVNTSKALDILLELVSGTNVHLKALHTDVVRTVSKYVLRILDVFGLGRAKPSAGGDRSKNEEALAELLSGFRSDVRSLLETKAEAKDFYKACDEVRENVEKCGFAIDDAHGGSVLRRVV